MRAADVPPSVIDELICFRGRGYREIVTDEFRRNSVFWVASLNGLVVASQFSRSGKCFRRWFLPLHDDDVVVFGGATTPIARRKGIMAFMISHHVRQERKPNAGAYADCAIWNEASMRCIEKAGFRRIARFRPLTCPQFMYQLL